MPISEVYNEGTTSYGYKYFYVNGKLQYVHRYVMEQHLGRKLLSSEIVHHKDENKQNNDISNLEITNRSAHARHHSHVIAVREFKGEIKYCADCGKPKYYPPKLANIHTRKQGQYKCRECYIKNKTWRVKKKY